MGESLLEGGNDGFSVALGADIDDASFQAANQRIGGLLDSLKRLTKLDFKDVTGSLKTIMAAAGGVITFTVRTNMDEVQNMLKATKAGLTNEDFKKWGNVEMGLGLGKGTLTKDLATLYDQISRITSMGQLDTKQFLALGLVGENATDFINEKDNTQRVMKVIDLALKSDRPIGEVGVLLEDALGSGMADLYRQLKMSGKDLSTIFNALTVFTSAASQSKALNFNLEYQTAMKHLQEMGALLASTFGEAMTPLITRFNEWVREYKDILIGILTFQQGWMRDLWDIAQGKIPSRMNNLDELRITDKEAAIFRLSDDAPNQRKNLEDWKKIQGYLTTAKEPLTATDISQKFGIQIVNQLSHGTTDWKGRQTGATIEQQRTEAAEQVRSRIAALAPLSNYQSVLDLISQYVYKQAVIGKDTYVGGYRRGTNYSDMTRKEKDSLREEGVRLDSHLSAALLRLSLTDQSKYAELVKLIKEAETVSPKDIPGLDQKVWAGQEIYTYDSFEKIFKFLEQLNGTGDKTSSLQINNEIHLSSVGTTDYETRRQGQQIGNAVSEQIRAGINYAMYAPGGLG